MNLQDAYHYMWREELTDWGNENIPNHIYVTKGTDLVGYVPRNTGVLEVFKIPKKSWSVTRRKFRKLGRKEIATYFTS